jgi:hypothetical protein
MKGKLKAFRTILNALRVFIHANLRVIRTYFTRLKSVDIPRFVFGGKVRKKLVTFLRRW